MSEPKLISIGHYSLTEDCLGKGCFAFVNKSRHSIIKRDVALKVMNKNKIKDEYVSRNYHREAEILSQLRHPNIVRLVEVLECKDFFCIAMELCSNGSLLEVLNDYGRLGDDQVRMFAQQIVSGLVYIHRKGIIHRDVKLENILLTDGGRRVVLADFGFSSAWLPGKKMHTFCGSHEYAAPELFQKNPNYGPKVDVWGLGILVYALAVGRLPFRITKEKDLLTLIKEICCGLREHQHSEMAGLNLNLRAFLLKCIEPKSALRATTDMLLGDQWLTKHGLHRMPELQEDVLSEKEQHWVASTIKDGLKTNCSTDTILKHLQKRPFNTTGGMFNLLSMELLQIKRFGVALSRNQQDMERLEKQVQSQLSSLKLENTTRKPLGVKAWRAWKRDIAENGNLHRLRRASSAGYHNGENKTGALTDITNTPQHNGKDHAETPNAPRKPALVHLPSKTYRLKADNEDEKKTGKLTQKSQKRLR